MEYQPIQEIFCYQEKHQKQKRIDTIKKSKFSDKARKLNFKKRA